MRRLGKKKHSVLSRTGAYGRGVMKKSIRPALKHRKLRTVHMRVGRFRYVPGQGVKVFYKDIDVVVRPTGPIVDAKTNRFAFLSKGEADLARKIAAQRTRGQGEGKPPRSKTGKLKNNIDFGIDLATESVVVGAYPFPKQPQLVAAVSVPNLLDKGGGEVIKGQLVKYGKRPFVDRVLPIAFRKMAELVQRTPL